jgi:proteasome lid subunit RPN8/RPN11
MAGMAPGSPVVGVAREALETARAAAEDAHPNEYMALLGGEPAADLGLDRDGTVVTELLVIPGTRSNSVSATVRTNMIPNRDTVGSVHSHPNGVLRPSDADLGTFGRGSVHLILGAPYGPEDWRAYDREGREQSLPVLDVDLPDPEEFFHFTQADLDREARPGDGG